MMRIGIDLDNTLIHYDNAFITAAKERGLVPTNFSGTKQQVRDHIRTLTDGETKWQALQGYVYGKGITHAALFPGAVEFIAEALAHGHELFIASHKTEFGHFDPDKINLRDAAIGFLEAQGFFTTLGFNRANISFHSTRAEKVDKITALNLDWFIDDLVEVYEEAHFPATTRKILFHTLPPPLPAGPWQVCHSWQDIRSVIVCRPAGGL